MFDLGVPANYNFVMRSDFQFSRINDTAPVYKDTYELPYTIKVHAKNGRYFSVVESGYIAEWGDYDTWEITDPFIIEKTFTDYDFDPNEWTVTTVFGTPPEPEPTYDVKISQADINTMFSKNFDGFVNGEQLVLNDELNYPFTIEFRAKTGYKFVNITPNHGDSSGDTMLKNTATYNADKTTATMTFKDTVHEKFGDFPNYNILMETYTPTPTFNYTVTQAMVNHHAVRNTTAIINDKTVVSGDGFNYPFDVAIRANDGYVFESAYEQYDVDVGDFITWDLSSDGKVQTYTFYDNYVYNNFSIDPVADVPVDPVDPEPPTFDFTVTQAFIDSLRAKKATLYINEVLAADGQQYNLPYDVRIEIDPTHYATVYSGEYDADLGDYVGLNPSDDFKTLTGTVKNTNIDEWTIETTLDESVVPSDKVAYNNVFVLTPEQTREIATTQFVWFKTATETTDAEPQGDSIISFIELPFTLPSELVQGSKTVQIGMVTSRVVADYVNIDHYVYDMGTISVPQSHDNMLDFDNTVAVLHLPYTNPINIDIDYVMGCDLSVTYDVNFYDGVASVNISSSKIDGVIDTKSIKLNIDIPFGKPDDNPSQNSPRNIELGIDNGVLIPYVEILRNDAVLADGFFTVPVPDESLLVNQVGFVKVDEIDLKVTASKDEKEMILRALDSGVIIK